MEQCGVPLQDILKHLSVLAPTHLAESWDNVGLLVEPSGPFIIKVIMLTNDLTEPVLEEAISSMVDMIISYHPPIFSPLKRLTGKSWKERVIVRAIENRIAIYSPHTASDAVKHGVNDWLIGCFQGETLPIAASFDRSRKLKVTIQGSSPDEPTDVFGLGKYGIISSSNGFTQVICSSSQFPELAGACMKQGQMLEAVRLEELPLPGTGMGRVCRLHNNLKVADVIEKIKAHLCLTKIRVALGFGITLESEVSSIAVCAGSGSTVLRGFEADVFVTGEMSHHDVLDAVSNKRTVILCDHSNSERGYLKCFADNLRRLTENRISIAESKTDRDPLEIM